MFGFHYVDHALRSGLIVMEWDVGWTELDSRFLAWRKRLGLTLSTCTVSDSLMSVIVVPCLSVRFTVLYAE